MARPPRRLDPTRSTSQGRSLWGGWLPSERTWRTYWPARTRRPRLRGGRECAAGVLPRRGWHGLHRTPKLHGHNLAPSPPAGRRHREAWEDRINDTLLIARLAAQLYTYVAFGVTWCVPRHAGSGGRLTPWRRLAGVPCAPLLRSLGLELGLRAGPEVCNWVQCLPAHCVCAGTSSSGASCSLLSS